VRMPGAVLRQLARSYRTLLTQQGPCISDSSDSDATTRFTTLT
jgi:hypothetical protein